MADSVPSNHLPTHCAQRHSGLAGYLLAGSLFVAIFWVGYRSIDGGLYLNRDDGIITVSHARNLIEYGSVGVNPSGDRVEGYSSPLQFLFFAALYALTGMHYSGYFLAVTYLSAFVLGLLFYALCLPHRKLGIALIVVGAIVLALDFSFFEWHASGMENALTHTSFLLAVVLLARMYGRGRVVYVYALPLLAASIARIESIYHIAPLLALFALFWLFSYRDPHGPAFAALVVALWGAFFVARWWYFGALFPNTATAQGISIGERVGLLFSGDQHYIREHFALSYRLFQWHHGLALLPALACLPFMRWNRRNTLGLLLLSSLVLTGLFSPFLFGAARLDVTRLSTQVAVAAVALAVLAAAQTRRRAYHFATVPILVIGLGGMIAWGMVKWEHKPYYLWFSEDVFAEYRNELLNLRDQHDIFRPTLANPDLGLMSWHKDFNIVDLGYLGNPVLAKLDAVHDPSKGDIANYFFDIAAPDLVEMHGVWSERHAHLFKDPRFQERYVAASSSFDALLKKRFDRNADFRVEYEEYVRAGYWVRRDMMADSDSAERRLVDDLRRELSVARLEHELETCKTENHALDEAQYVARTAYRFVPEFVAQGSYGEVVALLERYAPVLGYSAALLRARETRDWHDELFAYVQNYGTERAGVTMARALAETTPPLRTQGRDANTQIAEGLWLTGCQVIPVSDGWARLQLLFECEASIEKEWKVFVHGIVPEARRIVLPEAKRETSFVNWDLGFPDPPTDEWHAYGNVVLTQYVRYHGAVESVRVGLYRPREGAYGKPVILSPSAAADSQAPVEAK